MYWLLEFACVGYTRFFLLMVVAYGFQKEILASLNCWLSTAVKSSWLARSGLSITPEAISHALKSHRCSKLLRRIAN